MSQPLATYLHDHLAGSHFAVELLKTLREAHAGQPLSIFAADLLLEIEKDRQVLTGISDRIGKTGLDAREATAWLAEKISQFKLRHDDPAGLGTFEALEALVVGIHGKLALWQALNLVATVDSRVDGVDYEQLAARARAQHDQVDEWRLRLARTTFAVGTSDRRNREINVQ